MYTGALFKEINCIIIKYELSNCTITLTQKLCIQTIHNLLTSTKNSQMILKKTIKMTLKSTFRITFAIVFKINYVKKA